MLNGVDELSFEKGTIFHVMDTLPSWQLGAWHVERIGSHGEVMETGFVPTVISPTEMVETRMATSLPISILQGFSEFWHDPNPNLKLEWQHHCRYPARLQ